jgi:hypothetical protein
MKRSASWQRILIDAQQIRVDLPSRQDDRIVVISRNISELAIDLNGVPPSFISQPLISPLSGETTSTIAPASFSRLSGISSSDCSNPCVAKIAIRFPGIFIVVSIVFGGFKGVTGTPNACSPLVQQTAPKSLEWRSISDVEEIGILPRL